MIHKHLVFIFAHAPYDSLVAKEGLDALLAASIFDQRLSVVFVGDGVFQLLKDQSPVGHKNYAKMLQTLPLYEINDCFVHTGSMDERSVSAEKLSLKAIPLNDAEMQSLFATADHVLSF